MTLGGDVDYAAPTFSGELDCPWDESEEGIVFATTNTGTGMEVSSALTNDDFTGLDRLATIALNT